MQLPAPARRGAAPRLAARWRAELAGQVVRVVAAQIREGLGGHAAVDAAGKSPLHQAEWRGDIANVALNCDTPIYCYAVLATSLLIS